MPQTTLLPDLVPEMGDLDLRTSIWPNVKHPDEMVITARITLVGKPVPAVFVWVMTGIQRDYYDTLSSEVTSAWRWGERPKDVWRAGNDVMRLAKAHARAHEF